MSSSIVECLNQIATFCRMQDVKITVDTNSIPSCTHKSQTVVGALNIALMFLEATKSSLCGKTPEEKAQIYEWFEYAVLYGYTGNSQVAIKELNDVLSVRTFLVNDRLTVADIIMYYAIYNSVENMGYLDKERSAHLSRWFDNMQQDKQLCQKNKPIDFSTNYLVSVAPARH